MSEPSEESKAFHVAEEATHAHDRVCESCANAVEDAGFCAVGRALNDAADVAWRALNPRRWSATDQAAYLASLGGES